MFLCSSGYVTTTEPLIPMYSDEPVHLDVINPILTHICSHFLKEVLKPGLICQLLLHIWRSKIKALMWFCSRPSHIKSNGFSISIWYFKSLENLLPRSTYYCRLGSYMKTLYISVQSIYSFFFYTFLIKISHMHQSESSQSAGCHKCNETPPTQYWWSRLSKLLSVTVGIVIIYIHTYLMSQRITWDLQQSFQGLYKNLWKYQCFELEKLSNLHQSGGFLIALEGHWLTLENFFFCIFSSFLCGLNVIWSFVKLLVESLLYILSELLQETG